MPDTPTTIKVTGFQLRNALNSLRLQRDAAYRTLEASQFAFEGEIKDPIAASVEVEALETRIAKIETAQMAYNLAINVTFQGQPVSLAFAVKHVGGRGRIAKQWRGVVAPKKDRYSTYDDLTRVRDNDKEVAKQVVDMPVAFQQFQGQEKAAVDLRNAIAVANGQQFETALITTDDLGGS
jgi:hypothetical protein